MPIIDLTPVRLRGPNVKPVPFYLPECRNRIVRRYGCVIEPGTYQVPDPITGQATGTVLDVQNNCHFSFNAIGYLLRSFGELPEHMRRWAMASQHLVVKSEPEGYGHYDPMNGDLTIVSRPHQYRIKKLVANASNALKQAFFKQINPMRPVLYHELGHKYHDELLPYAPLNVRVQVHTLYSQGLDKALDWKYRKQPDRRTAVKGCLTALNRLHNHAAKLSDDAFDNLFVRAIKTHLGPVSGKPKVYYRQHVYPLTKSEVMAELYHYYTLESQGKTPFTQRNHLSQVVRRRQPIMRAFKPLYDYLKADVFTPEAVEMMMASRSKSV